MTYFTLERKNNMVSLLENLKKLLRLEVQTNRLTDKYTVVKELNHGAFSRVYAGIEKATGREVAIKVMAKVGLTEKQKMNTFREVAIHKSLNHPNIVEYIEFFEESDKYCLIMELMKGGELFERIEKREFFTEEDARLVISQAANAVKYLHENKVMHRDIKPENLVFLGDDLTPIKLCDFGLSKAIEETTDTPCGTVGYLAPEIAKEQKHNFGVDIWGLGCVLYSLLCGFPVFYDDNIQILTAKVKKGIYDFPSPWWDSVSPLAIDLIRNCLAVDPTKRYNIYQFLDHPWIKNEAQKLPLTSPAVLKGAKHKDVYSLTYAANREMMEDFSGSVQTQASSSISFADLSGSSVLSKREKKKNGNLKKISPETSEEQMDN